MMQVIGGWFWRKYGIPQEITEKKLIVKVLKLKMVNSNGIDLSKTVIHPVCFITGDGACLSNDCKTFEGWGIPHDLYATNRSLLFHQRQVDHWAAIDIEESTWFTQNVNKSLEPNKPIVRHTIGEFSMAYDVYWQMDCEFENDYQKRIFIANTGYFAVLTAIQMGYKKIVLGGMPLDQTPHYYDPPDTEGPVWAGICYQNWMDFKMLHPQADQVRSLGGYSGFILGKATKEWLIE